MNVHDAVILKQNRRYVHESDFHTYPYSNISEVGDFDLYVSAKEVGTTVSIEGLIER